jgi:chorismate-pyruvate lyase
VRPSDRPTQRPTDPATSYDAAVQMIRHLTFVLTAFAITLSSHAQTWSDSYQSRVEALAVMQTLNADLLASTSATATLEKWCRDHAMAADAKITACLVRGADKAPSEEQLERLHVVDARELKYRRVELRCGTRILSEADNWYVPARLTDAMNEQLETTDAPFGRVVQSLRPYRRTLAASMLWSPLPAGWELAAPTSRGTTSRLEIPKELFRHRAMLFTSASVPFAEVVETYQADVLAFARTSH